MTHFPDNLSSPVICLEETDSTSNHLQRLAAENKLQEFTVVTAGYQNAGKGQRGNSWESEKGKNLLFSFITYPGFVEARRQFVLSQTFSLAIKEELDVYANGFSIKWPNDIYWQEKKICGTLIENDLVGNHISRCVTGIGINLNQREFRSPAPNPVSLWQITGQEYDVQDFLHNVMTRTKEYYTCLQNGGSEEITRRYRQALFHAGEMHYYRDASGVFKACISGVSPEGLLMLEDENGKQRKYSFKEVQYILNPQLIIP